MSNLEVFANIAEITGALFVIGGLVFAVYEIRQARQQRRREAANEIFNNLGSREFLNGIKMLYEMPEGLSKADMEERYGDRMENMHWVLTQFENLGTMVANHMVPLDLAFEFFQPSIINTQRKLRRYIEELRDTSQNRTLYFYFEWMAHRVAEMAEWRTFEVMEKELEHWRQK